MRQKHGILVENYNGWPVGTKMQINGYMANSSLNGKIRITYQCKMPDDSKLEITTKYIKYERIFNRNPQNNKR